MNSWTQGRSDSCYCLWLGRTDSPADRVLSAFALLFADRDSGDANPSKLAEPPELVMTIGNESRTPDWSRVYRIFDGDAEIYGLFLGVYDLEEISKTAGVDLKRIVVVSLLKDGFSNSRKDVKRGKRFVERVKKAIAKECGVKKLTKEMRDSFSDAVKLSMFTNKQKTALAVGGAAAAALIVAYVKTTSEYDDEEQGFEAEGAEGIAAIASEAVSTILPEYHSVPVHDGVERRSASQLGNMIGMTGRDVNLKLHELGYLSGEPGNWTPTEKALPYVIERGESNGYGGYAARSWSYLLWDKNLVHELGDPEAYLSKVNEFRASMGMEPLSSLDIDS